MSSGLSRQAVFPHELCGSRDGCIEPSQHIPLPCLPPFQNVAAKEYRRCSPSTTNLLVPSIATKNFGKFNEPHLTFPAYTGSSTHQSFSSATAHNLRLISTERMDNPTKV